MIPRWYSWSFHLPFFEVGWPSLFPYLSFHLAAAVFHKTGNKSQRWRSSALHLASLLILHLQEAACGNGRCWKHPPQLKSRSLEKWKIKKTGKLRICNWISTKFMCYHEKSGWFEDCYGEREVILNLQDQHFPKSTKSYQVFTIERGCSLSISTLIFWNQEGCYFGDVLVNHQRNTKKQAKKWWKIMHISCLQLDVLRCLCLGYQSPMEVCIRCIWQDRFTALLSAVYHHLWIARTAELLNMAATLMSRFHISTFTGWYPESTFEFTDVSHVRTSVEASGMLHTSVTESRSIFDQ